MSQNSVIWKPQHHSFIWLLPHDSRLSDLSVGMHMNLSHLLLIQFCYVGVSVRYHVGACSESLPNLTVSRYISIPPPPAGCFCVWFCFWDHQLSQHGMSLATCFINAGCNVNFLDGKKWPKISISNNQGLILIRSDFKQLSTLLNGLERWRFAVAFALFVFVFAEHVPSLNQTTHLLSHAKTGPNWSSLVTAKATRACPQTRQIPKLFLPRVCEMGCWGN